MLISEEKQKREEWSLQIPDLCRQQLLSYAESFRELARSFGGDFVAHRSDRRELLEEHRLWENRQVISSNLIEVSKIMTQMAGEVFHFRPMDHRRGKMISQALKEEKITAGQPLFFPDREGNGAIGISLTTGKKNGIPGEFVADYLSVLLKRRLKLSVNSPCLIDQTSRCFLFVEEPELVTLTGFARVVKDKENISGDNYSILESEHGKLHLLISDGTGSGEKACEDSTRVLDLMEHLIETGYDMDQAIGLVNAAMFVREDGSGHPTLDVCSLDLYGERGIFYKSGGAVSFLKRGRKVTSIEGGSLPLGIFQCPEIRREEVNVESGDYIIMVTDGVSESFPSEEGGLETFIGSITEQNPREIAEKIMQGVIMANEGHVRDDMSILVVGIWANAGISA